MPPRARTDTLIGRRSAGRRVTHRLVLAALATAASTLTVFSATAQAEPNERASTGNTIYIDADAPSGGDGSETNPLNAVADLPEMIESGDTVNIAGTFHNQPVSISGVANVTIQQWPGRSQAVLRGDVPIDAWSHVAGDVYAVDLDPNLAVSSVTWRWDDNVLDDGRHFGHLRPAETADDVADLPAHFHYDPSSGELLINTASLTDDPDDYTWCDGTGGAGHNALRISGGSGHLIDGLHTYLWIAPFGYGVYMSDVSDSTVANVVCRDTGKHAVGWVGGDTNVNNTTINCRSWGNTLDGASGATNFVYYVGSGTLDGAAVIDCEAHIYTRLDVTGEQIEAGGMTGFFSHTGFAGSTAGIVHENCLAVGYGGNARDFAVASNVSPDDPWDPQSYHSRFIECESRNVNSTGGTINTAYERCSLETQGAVAYGTGPTLFDACEIIADLEGGEYVFVGHTSNSPEWHTVNTSVLVRGDESSRNILHMNNDATFSSRGSVFAFADEQGLTYFVRGPTASPERLDIKHAAYFNIDLMASSSSWNDPDSWMNLVDPHAVWLDDPPYQNMSGTGSLGLGLDPAGTLWTLKEKLDIATSLGINNRPYDGSYGAHQYGLSADLNGDGLVNGSDLGLMLNQWGPCDDCDLPENCPADLTGDCNVGGADLGVLLNQWTQQ